MNIKTATTVDRQIEILKSRGMTISNIDKAKEILLDIGYYRLGFYWFPFELGYPKKSGRIHQFKEGTKFENAVALYYFDKDLRNILIPYLHRIEVNFRTRIIYIASNRYSDNPTWFSDPRHIGKEFLRQLPSLYMAIRKNDPIKLHHRKYINDIYAPAWKSLEYMTFGSMLCLFENIKDIDLKKAIMKCFGYTNLEAFHSHMTAIRTIRNFCAHGHNLFDYRFHMPLKSGGIRGMSRFQHVSISGVLIVVARILEAISLHRRNDFVKKVESLIANPDFDGIRHIISSISVTPERQQLNT